MQDVPFPAEDGLDLQPVLMDKLVDGRTGHPEDILQGGVAVSTSQVSEVDCQLESWTHGVSHLGPLPLELSSDSLFQLMMASG